MDNNSTQRGAPASLRQPVASLPRRTVLGLAAALPLLAPWTAAANDVPRLPFLKGGNVSAWNVTDVERVLADAARLGLDTLTIPVRLAMPGARSNAVDVEAESLAFAERLAAQAQAKGYRILIEPYPWIAKGTVAETALDPRDPPAWFAAHQKALLKLARAFPQAWGLYVASNLVRLEVHEAAWLDVVRAVRSQFAGKLLYRTQWWITAVWEPALGEAWTRKLNHPVFGAVDAIAVAAYFELSDLRAPTVADLKAALRATSVHKRKQDVLAELTALQQRWSKPIFLGELSCPARDFGAQTPWDPAVSAAFNGDIQRSMLTAWLESLPQDPAQFLGFSLFTIGHPVPSPYDLAPAAATYLRSWSRQPR